MINPALRPMSTSELLDRTFHLYRNHFFLFAGIAAVPPALALVIQVSFLAAELHFDRYTVGEALRHFGPLLGFLLAVVALLLMYLVALQFSYGATVYGVSTLHMGQQTTIRESYRKIRPYWLSLLAISILIGLRIAGIAILAAMSFILGPLALISIPLMIWWGTYVYCRCSLAGAACVLEGTLAGPSIVRSRSLTLDGAWRIFLILLLTGIVGGVLSYAFAAPGEILGRILKGHQTSMVALTSYLGRFLAQTLAGPIGTIALVLVYYDQRIRKEAFDLQVMMQLLDQGKMPAAT